MLHGGVSGYALAPEHLHQSALEDALSGYDWLLDQVKALNLDQGRVALMGESAGANIVLGMRLRLRAKEGPMPRFQALLYPPLDDRLAEPHPFAGRIGSRRASMRYAWDAFLQGKAGNAEIKPEAAPTRASDLSGLRATFMGVGALDVSVDENLTFAGRLIRAGVATEFHVYPGAPHAFDRTKAAAVSRAMGRDRLDALREALRCQNEGI